MKRFIYLFNREYSFYSLLIDFTLGSFVVATVRNSLANRFTSIYPGSRKNHDDMVRTVGGSHREVLDVSTSHRDGILRLRMAPDGT